MGILRILYILISRPEARASILLLHTTILYATSFRHLRPRKVHNWSFEPGPPTTYCFHQGGFDRSALRHEIMPLSPRIHAVMQDPRVSHLDAQRSIGTMSRISSSICLTYRLQPAREARAHANIKFGAQPPRKNTYKYGGSTYNNLAPAALFLSLVLSRLRLQLRWVSLTASLAWHLSTQQGQACLSNRPIQSIYLPARSTLEFVSALPDILLKAQNDPYFSLRRLKHVLQDSCNAMRCDAVRSPSPSSSPSPLTL